MKYPVALVALLTTAITCAQGTRTIKKTDASSTSPFNRKDARTISLALPAPRGIITDRFGNPLAQNKVACQLVLRFQQLENADEKAVFNYAKKRLDAANRFLEKPWEPTEKELWQHYRHRRWLPMVHKKVFTREAADSMRKNLVEGLEFLDIYSRSYPHKELAGHILGYTRSTGPLEKGPVNPDDPLWEFTSGARGLEKIFDKHLTGESGRKRLMFDQDGRKLLEDLTVSPKPGGTVVTTLDLKWQQTAERILNERTKSGAFVVIDIATGEVLVLASNPSFDPNEFGLNFDGNRYMERLKDKQNPLIGRAFQGVYPPASTFKPIVALAALDKRVVGPETLINCPAAIKLGKHNFKNWHSTPEGNLDAAKAIARSCNPWFYLVSQRFQNADGFLSTARQLGMGSKTGLPLDGEKSGNIPDNNYMRRVHNRAFTLGDRYSMSIGQGPILTTPLQVAQSMAGIADGFKLPKLHLVRQLQDRFGNVIYASQVETKRHLGFNGAAVAEVQTGMHDVVNAGYGTGKGASLSYSVVCGKTGTAQWGPESEKRRLAWFSGFFPLDQPRFAFAALYEGAPGERVSGGRLAAPIVHDFFEAVKSDAQRVINPPKAVVVVEDPPEPIAEPEVMEEPKALEGDDLDQAARRAVVVEPSGPVPLPESTVEPENEQPRRALVVEPPGADPEPPQPQEEEQADPDPVEEKRRELPPRRGPSPL